MTTGPERERPGAPLDGFKPEHFAELRLVLGQRDNGGRAAVRLARRLVKGGRDVPAGQVRARGGKGPRGGGCVQPGALLDVVHTLPELLRGAIAGDPPRAR